MAFFTSLLERIRPLVRTYPIELAFALVAAVLACVLFEDIRDPNLYLVHVVLLSPCCFAAIYLANIHRLGYKIIWLYPILCSALFGYVNVVERNPILLVGFYLIHAVLFFTKGFERDNRKFTHLTLATVINTAFAMILSGVLFGLISIVLHSIEFLFDIRLVLDWVHGQIWLFIGIFFTAFFFLMLESRSAPYDLQQDRLLYVGDILINWIFSPAVMIYTAIVYVYLVMILFQFELPAGRVSTVILPYLGLGLFCIALRQFSEKPKWQWFYCYFARLSLLPLGLLWLGIYERVSVYGLTETRIYLIGIAALVTLFMLLSLSQKTLQYRLFSGLTIVTVVVMTILLNPTKLAQESQHRQFVSLMRSYNLLDEQGKIREDILDGRVKWHLGEKESVRLVDLSLDLSEEYQNFYGVLNLDSLRHVAGQLDGIAVADEKPFVRAYFHLDDQPIDLSEFRVFHYFSDDYALRVNYLPDEDSENFETLSVLGHDRKVLFTVNQKHILQTLQQTGIENGKLYHEADLKPAVEKLMLLPTNEGTSLLLKSISLRYSEKNQHYIVESARVQGYFKP